MRAQHTALVARRKAKRGAALDPIRVHLGPMPEMLRTIIGDLIRREPDMAIVGGSRADGDVLRSALAERADVLIVQDRPNGTSLCLDTILAGAPLGIFAVSADGRNAAAVNLVRRHFALDCDRHPSALADALRATASPPSPST